MSSCIGSILRIFVVVVIVKLAVNPLAAVSTPGMPAEGGQSKGGKRYAPPGDWGPGPGSLTLGRASPSSIEAVASMVGLLTTPRRYAKKLIRTWGVLWVGPGGQMLCLSKDDVEFRIYANCLWLELSEADFGVESEEAVETLREWSMRHVLVEGTFSTVEKGHLGSFPGSIVRPVRVDVKPSRFKDRDVSFDPEEEHPARIDRGEPTVPFVRLLTVGERYEGKRVQVTGYLAFGNHTSGVCLDRGSSKIALENCLAIDWSERTVKGSYDELEKEYDGWIVYIAGTFDGLEDGEALLFGYSGHLRKITRVFKVARVGGER